MEVDFELEACYKISRALQSVRKLKPVVHHITNYVTANDCANITLAIGASPVMADDICEVRDMVSHANSLVINLGTLDSRTVESMIEAGKRANELNIPVILDPVGAGATPYRTKIAREIMNEIKIAVVRGNLSEIKALYGIDIQTKGVDSSENISMDEDVYSNIKSFARDFANTFHTVVAITGKIDIITDGRRVKLIKNGHEILSRITGTGCMSTSLIGSYVGAENDDFYGALAGVATMGIAGEIGYNRLDKDEGTGSLKVKILDAIYHLSEEDILKWGKIYEV